MVLKHKQVTGHRSQVAKVYWFRKCFYYDGLEVTYIQQNIQVSSHSGFEMLLFLENKAFYTTTLSAFAWFFPMRAP